MKLYYARICVMKICKFVGWCLKLLKASISYQDDTLAFFTLKKASTARLLPTQHLQHVALESLNAANYGKLTFRRDDIYNGYVHDPLGTTVEFLEPTPADLN